MASTTTGFVYDPSTPQFQEEIWSVYRTLRDEHPVYHDPDRRFYALSRYDDVWWAVNDWQSFSSVVDEANSLRDSVIVLSRAQQEQRLALLRKHGYQTVFEHGGFIVLHAPDASASVAGSAGSVR